MKIEFSAIGSNWQIDLPVLVLQPEADLLLDVLKARAEQFDLQYSRFRSDSVVTAMASKAGTYTFSADASPMLQLYWDLYQLTEGKFTPLVGNVLVQAGYDANYSLTPTTIHPAPLWEDALMWEGNNLTTQIPLWFDFGGLGKGYLVDIFAAILQERDHADFTIIADGDIAHRNADGQSFRVGLENPNDPKQIIGVAEIANQSICGSAGNRRRWSSFHHIIDPFILKSPEHILATWVVAKSTLLADGLATCLFLVKPETLLGKYDFEYLILYADYTIQKSPNWKGELFVSS